MRVLQMPPSRRATASGPWRPPHATRMPARSGGGDRARLNKIAGTVSPSPFQVLRPAVVPLGAQSELSNRDDLRLAEGATVDLTLIQRLLDVHRPGRARS